MRNFIRPALLACLLGASAFNCAMAASLAYTATFQTGYPGSSWSVTGTFDGTVNGNIVTDLSNITAVYNGTTLAGSGNLFGAHYDANTGWQAGGAVASFDGTQNNFLFIDVDYPNNFDFTNYFYDISGLGGDYAGNSQAYIADPEQYGDTTSTWSLTNTSVPEPATLGLLGLGMAGLGFSLRRKRKLAA